ncbi:glycosyltransferase family 61 protein [Mesobacterium pallidum]|uniref:glycosyltransferase family 61 protein n=1 Tax=Mesobacterium pallidum TaxID=2872037 RepID=UPI001EE18E7A|nr:glycosyltransferase family 61 protein [Mesobacterium pallidum]
MGTRRVSWKEEAEHLRPRPDSGWSRRIEVLGAPTVVPPADRTFVQAAGLLRADGSYCGQGALWRKSRLLTEEPEAPQGPVTDLPGSWLWGGVLWRHFGHFIVESTGRMWGLTVLPEPVRGVIFIPKSPREDALKGFHADFFGMCGLKPHHVRIATAPLRPERLYVPGQGFGLGDIAAGTDRCQDFFRTRFAQQIAPEGPERLYISRSRLAEGKGKLVLEDRLEAHLTAEGYEIFHPQEHDLATQVSRYKAARQVVATEGSALHLLAMVARPDQSVAMILRRMAQATEYITSHLRGFAGIEPLMIDALRDRWRPADREATRHQVGVPDFAAVQSALRQGGFVGDGPAWPQPDTATTRDAISRLTSFDMVPVEPD